MAATIIPDAFQDVLAVSLVNAVATANKKALEAGIDTGQSLVTVTQEDEDGTTVWRVDYVPKDYLNMRGGGLTVDVDASTIQVRRILHGQ